MVAAPRVAKAVEAVPVVAIWVERAWFAVDLAESISFWMEVMPWLAAWMVWTPLEIASSRPPRSLDRIVEGGGDLEACGEAVLGRRGQRRGVLQREQVLAGRGREGDARHGTQSILVDAPPFWRPGRIATPGLSTILQWSRVFNASPSGAIRG